MARDLPEIGQDGVSVLDHLEQPVWIFDRATLRFLFVNTAARDWLGYDAHEFADMTIADIRPAEEREAIRKTVAGSSGPRTDAGSWRIVTKSGEVRDATIRWRRIQFRDSDAVVATINDVTELRRAEQSANLARWQKDEILDGISDGFFAVDRDWKFTYVNSKAEEIFQRKQDTLLGRNIWEVFPETVGTPFHTEYTRALDTGSTGRFVEHYAPLGIWLEVMAYPTADGLAVHVHDVTQEHDKTQQLRLLESAVSRLNDILLITDATPMDAPGGPKIAYVNEAFCRRTGFSREEAIGNTPRMLQGPKTDRRELDRIRDALTHARPVRSEVLNYTRSGEEYWLEIDIAPLLGADGRPSHFVAIERDITERKRLQEAQSISEERFRLVSRAANEVIWDWDIRAGTLWWNERMQSLFGHDPASLAPGALSWRKCLHPEDRARTVESIARAMNGSGTAWADEFRFRRADGTYALVSSNGVLIRSTGGKALRMVGSLLDVTEQRALEAQLREAQKLETVGRLTGGIAHDFNNLLTVILGVGEVLAEKLQHDQKLRALAEMTIAAAERGAELTGRLLAFARRQPLEPRVIDANQLVQELQELARRAVTPDIDIALELDPACWPVEVDQHQLESALLNLAINAGDAMPEGGRLRIETANCHLDDDRTRRRSDVPAGDYVMIAVSDNGTGMDPETKSRAFEPFFTTKPVGKGSGLGLSMVMGFVKQSLGHVEISSEPGESTTVRMFFPRSAGVVAGDADARTDHGTVGGTEHLLVVEDDERVRKLLCNQLLGLGYRVTVALNGPDALARSGALDDIDLLITDMMMPDGMNGVQLASAAARLKPDLQVLFVTGYAEDALVHESGLHPDFNLLGKPYRRRELARKVRDILDRG